MKNIQSIDMSFDPFNEEAKTETVLKIKEACISTGFFYIQPWDSNRNTRRLLEVIYLIL